MCRNPGNNYTSSNPCAGIPVLNTSSNPCAVIPVLNTRSNPCAAIPLLNTSSNPCVVIPLLNTISNPSAVIPPCRPDVKHPDHLTMTGKLRPQLRASERRLSTLNYSQYASRSTQHAPHNTQHTARRSQQAAHSSQYAAAGEMNHIGNINKSC